MINPLVKNAYKLLPKIFAIEMLASTNKKQNKNHRKMF